MVCSIEGCTRTVRARGLCSSHYSLYTRSKNPEKHKAYNKEYRAQNRDKLKQLRKKWNDQNPEYFRWRHLLVTYHLTRDDYEALLRRQNMCCAICASPTPGRKREVFSVDHDHSCCPGSKSCGQCVRGLLCVNCNTVVGAAKDNLEILAKISQYLKENNADIAR